VKRLPKLEKKKCSAGLDFILQELIGIHISHDRNRREVVSMGEGRVMYLIKDYKGT